MQPSWNCELLQKSDPIQCDSIGNQFVRGLHQNIKEISQLFLQLQFDKSLNYITDIICLSKKVFATQLDQSSTKLKNFLDEFIEVQEGIIQTKNNFQIEQQQQAVEKFIEVIQIARTTINDWYQFKQQIPQKDLFQQEIDQLKESFNVLQERHHCNCQLI